MTGTKYALHKCLFSWIELSFRKLSNLYKWWVALRFLIISGGVLVSWGCCDKLSWLGALKRQKFIFSQFWMLEVWQGSAGPWSLWRLQRRIPPRLFLASGVFLAFSCITPISACLHMVVFDVSLYFCVFLFKDTEIRFKAHANKVWPPLNLYLN